MNKLSNSIENQYPTTKNLVSGEVKTLNSTCGGGAFGRANVFLRRVACLFSRKRSLITRNANGKPLPAVLQKERFRLLSLNRTNNDADSQQVKAFDNNIVTQRERNQAARLGSILYPINDTAIYATLLHLLNICNSVAFMPSFRMN